MSIGVNWKDIWKDVWKSVWEPEAEPETPDASIRTISVVAGLGGLQTKRVAASLWFEFDWSAVLPSGVTLESVVHSVPSGLTLVDESYDTEESTSVVKVSGGSHGGLYPIRGIATLSNGDQVPEDITLRVFG
jgi:hypothetical protein